VPKKEENIMKKLDIIKAAVVVTMGEAFAHYGVLPTGALMFGGREAYEKGKFLVVGKDKVYFTNPFGREADIDVTEKFNSILDNLEEADKVDHIEARRRFTQMCREEEIGGVDTATNKVVRSILREKMMQSLSWEEIENILSIYAPWRMECHSRGFLPKKQTTFVGPDVPWEDLPF
jgi:hypothetical protein